MIFAKHEPVHQTLDHYSTCCTHFLSQLVGWAATNIQDRTVCYQFSVSLVHFLKHTISYTISKVHSHKNPLTWLWIKGYFLVAKSQPKKLNPQSQMPTLSSWLKENADSTAWYVSKRNAGTDHSNQQAHLTHSATVGVSWAPPKSSSPCRKWM